MADMAPCANLARFGLAQLASFVAGGAIATNASPDFLLFDTGEDDVHGALKYMLPGVTRGAQLTMYGMDDPELFAILWAHMKNPELLIELTLDLSQAGGVAEKAILDAARTTDLRDFQTHIAIGQSSTHQIIHAKGGVLDSCVAFEGSVNWSRSGEGEFVQGQSAAGGPGFKAQENTMTVFTCPWNIARFSHRLRLSHLTAQAQQAARAGKAA